MPISVVPKGIACPLCRSTKFTSVGRKRPTANLRVRYFRCDNCINPETERPTRFKSKERVDGLTQHWKKKSDDSGTPS